MRVIADPKIVSRQMSRLVLRLIFGLEVSHNIILKKTTGLKNARLILPSNLSNLRVTEHIPTNFEANFEVNVEAIC